ncbi:TetR/AcrR family transcriptional regulator [Streptomyces sp. NPDC004291]
MSTESIRRRPGGRSTKVRSAVVTATLDLLAESGPEKLSIGEVATRAGVHETSIYRRWKTRERLILDAMTERSTELLKIPDTGSVRGDLVALGQELVDYGTSPLGEALMRTLAANTDDSDTAQIRSQFWAARYEECQSLVERATARGELPYSADGRTLLEVFIAPIHFRLLMTREPVDSHLLKLIADITVAGIAAAHPA